MKHSFAAAASKKNEALSFNETLKYNDELKTIAANSIQVNRTQFEEINQEVLHRDNEFIYEGNYALPEELSLYTRDSAALISELSSTVKARKYQFFGELERASWVPILGEFTPGLGCDSSKYSLRPYSWHRLYEYVYASRSWWVFEFSGRVTDYLDERGGSPFRFDQRFVLHDNIKTGAFINIGSLKLGQTVQYSTYDGAIFDIGYIARYKTAAWVLKAEHSVKREVWALSIEMSLI